MKLAEKLSKQAMRNILSVDKDISCLLYTSDAADERSSVDLGGRRIIKKKKQMYNIADLVYTRYST